MKPKILTVYAINLYISDSDRNSRVNEITIQKMPGKLVS